MRTATTRLRWSINGSAFLILCFLLAGSAAAQRVVNENGGFEASTPGETSGIMNWQLWILEGATASAEVVEDPADPENLVLRVEITDVSVTTNPWDVQVVHYVDPQLALVEGHEYQVSFRIRAENPTAATVQLDGGAGAQLWGQSISGEDWTVFEAGPFVAGAEDARTIGIHLSDNANQNGQVFYIDDMEVVDLDDQTGLTPVIVQAEDGDLGSEVETATDDLGITYITPTTDISDTTGETGFPRADRTATYEVTFDEPGWYDFYAHVYVGPNTFNDDSFFYADSFEVKDPDVADGWFFANGLASAGYNVEDEYVSGLGAVGSEMWKWVNLTEAPGEVAPLDSFYVAPGELTVTFQIGAREDGLWIDQFAFGRSDLFFTVANLNNGEPGSLEMGGPEIVLPENPIAEGKPKFIGNIYSPSQVENFEYYWDYVIAENAGKWGSVEGTRDQMNWAGLDASYALAQENGLEYNFHVLLWGAQQPGWISDLEPAEQLEEIREWMEAVAERYPDMDVVQVANEILPTHNPPDGQNGRADYKEALGGDGATGYDYVIAAFEMAREVFGPDQRLMLNDYGILGSTDGARQYLEVIELLQERDLIDVIGVQGHAFSTRQGAPIEQVLDLLGATGLPIQVTEMDVDGNANASPLITDEQSDANQLRDMQRIFPVIWEHPSVEGVTFWGWRPGLWRQDQEAYLVQSDGEERPALVWLREYLAEYGATPAEALNGNGGFEDFALGAPSGTADWYFQISEATDATLTIVDTPVQEGSRALSVEVDGIAGANLQFSNQAIEVPGPGTYQYSGWARASEDGARLQVVGDHQGGSYSWFGNTTVDLTTEWTEIAFEFEVPAESGGAAVELIRATHILKFEENVGKTIYLDNVRVTPVGNVDAEPGAAPRAFELAQNYPNPFRSSTTIRYVLDTPSDVSLAVFNALGQRVATLVEGPQGIGRHEVEFRAADLASGVYFYRLSVGGDVEARRMLVVR